MAAVCFWLAVQAGEESEAADQLTLMVVGKEAVTSLLNTVSKISPAVCLHASCFHLHKICAFPWLTSSTAIVQGGAGAKAKEGIFALLWNRGSEQFQVCVVVASFLSLLLIIVVTRLQASTACSGQGI